MSKTEENLKTAFAGEAQARNKYTFFAEVAKKAGLEQIAAIFEETANNEKAHAERIAELLKIIKNTNENLKTCIAGEHYERAEMYPNFEKIAREENQKEAAEFFKEVAEVEEKHEERYKKLLENSEKGTVFKKDEVARWKCRNCGYIHEGKEPPKICPLCKHPQSYYELLCENY